jgi:predicted RNA-binding protein with RPS1 domain
MVIVRALPDFVYEAERPTDPADVAGPATYRRLPSHHGASVVDQVEVGTESVLHGRRPERFACLSRRAYRRRTNPIEPPVTITQVWGVVLVERPWLDLRVASTIEAAVQIRDRCFAPDGLPSRPKSFSMWARDQSLVPGSRHSAIALDRAGDGFTVRIVGQTMAAPELSQSPRSIHRIWLDEDNVSDVDERAPRSDLDGAADEPVDADQVGPEEAAENEVMASPKRVAVSSTTPEPPPVAVIRAPDLGALTRTLKRGEQIEVEVDIHRSEEERDPLIFVHPVPAGDSVALFAFHAAVGQVVTVRITDVYWLRHEPRAYLCATHEPSGMRFVLGAERLTLCRRSFALARMAPGQTLELDVDAIDVKADYVRLSRLAHDVNAIDQKFAGGDRLVLEGRVAEVLDERIYVSVDLHGPLPMGFESRSVGLPKRPAATRLGADGMVELRRPREEGDSHEALPAVSSALARNFARPRAGRRVRLQGDRLEVRGRMSTAERRELMTMDSDLDWHDAIDRLFCRSQGLLTNFIDPEAIERYCEGAWHEGTVVELLSVGAKVTLTGDQAAFLHISEMAWTRLDHPSDVLKVREVVDCRVIEAKIEGGLRIRVSLLDPDQNPYAEYDVGDDVEGVVVEVRQNGAQITIDDDVDAWIPVSELSWAYVSDAADELDVGQRVDGVTLKPLREVGMRLEGTVDDLQPYGAFVDLGKYGRGLVHIRNIAAEYVRDPADYLSEGERVTVVIVGIIGRKLDLSIKDA